jgi:hypothetical protein
MGAVLSGRVWRCCGGPVDRRPSSFGWLCIRQSRPATERTLEIMFPDAGAHAYAFTFG